MLSTNENPALWQLAIVATNLEFEIQNINTAYKTFLTNNTTQNFQQVLRYAYYCFSFVEHLQTQINEKSPVVLRHNDRYIIKTTRACYRLYCEIMLKTHNLREIIRELEISHPAISSQKQAFRKSDHYAKFQNQFKLHGMLHLVFID